MSGRVPERSRRSEVASSPGPISEAGPAHGTGQPLPAFAARWISSRLGADLDGVRVHTDSVAAELAARHEANAVTTGQDIHFAPGAYAPATPEGLVRLLHESTHAVQQRGSAAADSPRSSAQEAEVDQLLAGGEVGSLTTSAPGALREPTYPRRTTGNRLIAEAERVITLSRDQSSTDAQTRMWSNVSSNFGAITAGSIARRIWTYIFLRHFTEPDSLPGVESRHPRYFYSRTYGWVDGQHFFGFIDYAERNSTPARSRGEAFDAATERGFEIERTQQQVRDYVQLQRPPADDVTRLMQVQPPNTPAFRAPVAVAGAATRFAAVVRAGLLTGPEGELFRQLNEAQQNKFIDDSAKSAWTFEDPTSNQLGIRFYFQHGERINAMPVGAREGAFRNALITFFASIGIVEDQTELDRLAISLPGRERYAAPHTTEERERAAHPELYRLPPPP